MYALVFLALLALSQITSANERAIVAAVDAGNGEALALLEKAVNINSGTHNFPGVRAVGALFRREFGALGVKKSWVDGAPFKRAGHLVAEHPGKGRRMLLIGHLDTVFERDSPFQSFQRIDEKTAQGPGIIDMKGGDVIIIAALKALKTAGLLDDMNIIVVMTGDEEDAGAPQAAARAALIDAAQGAEYARASRDLGFGGVTAVSADRAGAADVSFVAGQVKNVLDGIGLMGRDDHSPSETADLTTLPSQTKRAA